MKNIKSIAIIAFDSKKTDLIEWSYFNKKLLIPHAISALGFAGNILEGTLNKKVDKSETGEYRQLRNRINKGEIDAVLIFGESDEIFETKDLNGVLEAAIAHNVIIAANRTTADFVLHSSLIETEYTISKNEKKLINNKEVIETNPSFELAKAS